MIHSADFRFSVLLLFGLGTCTLAQTASKPVSVSLSSERTTFDQKHDANIKLTVTNKLSTPLELGGGRSAVNLNLHKPRTYDECRISDCFGATFSRTVIRIIKPGESLELSIELTDLHWYDMILSGREFNEPKNFFTRLPSGTYQLSVDIIVPRKSDLPETISSNRVLVTVNSAVKPEP